MYKLSITIGGDLLVANIPANLSELTFGQLIKLTELDLSEIEKLHILTGIPSDQLYEADFDFLVENTKMYVDALMKHIANDPVKIAKRIVVKDKKRTCVIRPLSNPHNLSIEPVGSYLIAENAISDDLKAYGAANNGDMNGYFPNMETCLTILNAYLYRFVGPFQGTWDWDRDIHKCRDLSMSMPADQAMALSQHFFNRYPILQCTEPRSGVYQAYLSFKGSVKTFFDNLGKPLPRID